MLGQNHCYRACSVSEASERGSTGQVISGCSLLPLVSSVNILDKHEGIFFKANIWINLDLAALIMIISLWHWWQQLVPGLPLSGLCGLGCLDGAAILDDIPFLGGRSISCREREHHCFLCHGNHLFICPLLAQVLLGVIEALHRLQRGINFQSDF